MREYWRTLEKVPTMTAATINDNTTDIWEGDLLRRRGEADMLERFLKNESAEMVRQGRQQAVVLALDSKYGEGKTWFLNRFKQQLYQYHPVAFVDAWLDDANDDPLVTIMAAVEDALQPFLDRPNVKQRLAALRKAALPLLGKAAIGASGRLMARALGGEFGEHVRDAVQEGTDKVGDALCSIIDRAGEKALDQYRTRLQTRQQFKETLGRLAASINENGAGHRVAPIFIVIDELDRCRPSYAIRLLEDIKHLFDVMGIVFVIAIHGSQLAESIKAIYGAQFDANAYLRRFFTRRYSLRRLNVHELAASHLHHVPKGITLSAPPSYKQNRLQDYEISGLVGDLLTDWGATPRETLAIIDGLRLFVQEWDLPFPIEAPLVLSIIFNLVRTDQATLNPPTQVQSTTEFAVHTSEGFTTARFDRIFDHYHSTIRMPLRVVTHDPVKGPIEQYIQRQITIEYNQLPSQDKQTGTVCSWASYEDRVARIGRFLDLEETEDQ